MADKPYVSPRRLKRFFTGLLGEKLNTKEEILANTDEGKFAGAMALQEMYGEVNNSLVADIYVGDDGKLHKVQGGADSVLPFSSNRRYITYKTGDTSNSNARIDIYIYDDAKVAYHTIQSNAEIADLLGLAKLYYTGSWATPKYSWRLTFLKDVLVNDIPRSAGEQIIWYYNEDVEYKIVDNT